MLKEKNKISESVGGVIHSYVPIPEAERKEGSDGSDKKVIRKVVGFDDKSG